jgi:hypothetical protein
MGMRGTYEKQKTVSHRIIGALKEYIYRLFSFCLKRNYVKMNRLVGGAREAVLSVVGQAKTAQEEE